MGELRPGAGRREGRKDTTSWLEPHRHQARQAHDLRHAAATGLLFGLSGNPGFFAGPVRALLPCRRCGKWPVAARSGPYFVTAALADATKHRADRPAYRPGRLTESGGRLICQPLPDKGSADLFAWRSANCLYVLPVDQPSLAAGQSVQALPLEGIASVRPDRPDHGLTPPPAAAPILQSPGRRRFQQLPAARRRIVRFRTACPPQPDGFIAAGWPLITRTFPIQIAYVVEMNRNPGCTMPARPLSDFRETS